MPWLLTNSHSGEFEVVWRFEDQELDRSIELWNGPKLSPEEIARLECARILIAWPDKKPLPDILSGSGYPQIFSEHARKVVDELEPDAHTFVRIRLVHETGEYEIEASYFLLVVHQKVSAVIKDKSDYKAMPLSITGGKFDSLRIGDNDKRTLDRAAIKGLHLFRDTNFGRRLFCSDAFKTMIEDLPGDIGFKTCLVAVAGLER